MLDPIMSFDDLDALELELEAWSAGVGSVTNRRAIVERFPGTQAPRALDTHACGMCLPARASELGPRPSLLHGHACAHVARCLWHGDIPHITHST